MSEPWDSIQIPECDAPLVFQSKDKMLQWINEERNIWEWLWNTKKENNERTTLNLNHFSALQSGWNEGLNFVRIANDKRDNNYRNWANSRLSTKSANRLIVSDSTEGRDILHALKLGGPSAARWVYLSKLGKVPIAEAQFSADVRGLVLIAFPALASADRYKELLQTERSNYRNEIGRIRNAVNQFLADRSGEWAKRGLRARNISRLLLNRTKNKWDENFALFGQQAMDAISSINETRDTYAKQMALAAPVTYWKEKSEKHQASERWMLGISVGYFVTALSGLWFVAKSVATYILSLPQDADRTAIYVIASGGLLAFTTMVFWIGRLVIKLYLSEHHLRIDADERATMTKTYLAMTEEGSATDAERAIVLAAIFRPTPDGIVKEDGPNDASLGGILAKMLSSPR